MKPDEILNIKTIHSRHLTPPPALTSSSANHLYKILKLAFLLFKSPPSLAIMAGPFKKWLNTIAGNLYRFTAGFTSDNFSFIQDSAKLVPTTSYINPDLEDKPAVKQNNFYYLNNLSLEYIKNFTRANNRTDQVQAQSPLPSKLNGEEKNKATTSKYRTSKGLTLATEEISKTASFTLDLFKCHFQFSEYTYSLLQVPPGTKLASFHDLLHYLNTADQVNLAQKWELLLAQGLELDEITQLANNNQTIWLKIKAVLLSDNGDSSQIIGTIQDVTEFKEKEKQLLTQKLEAEHTSQVKSEFVSFMSHEIRTPLNAIMGLSYLLLQEENLRGKHKENLELIRFSSENLLGLINNTLDYSRIEAGKIELENLNFSLIEILNGIHRTQYHRAAEKHLEFNLVFDIDTPVKVAGDPARLGQVLNNLISNAIKFTHTGNITLSTKVLYESDLDYVLEFEVADTGIGIPQDRQELIFESFVQASISTHRQYGGTGLGLAITKKIIELHKGQIQLKSAPGKGSEFKVWLRYAKTSKETEPVMQNKSIDLSLLNLSAAKILVVDDNAMNKLVAQKLLQRWQIEVETADNGAIALEKLKITPYDLVLMDLNMPVMNGFEAIAEIRKLTLNMPVIALTASAREDEKYKVLALGANDYLSKPFVPEDLYNKLLKHLPVAS